jgi:predicted component of type VI protein secretion system
MNGVLARTGYTKTTSRVRGAAIEELPGGAAATVWIPPAWAVGALAVQSFRDTGWPCRLVGPRSGGAIGDLPVHEVSGDEGEAIAIPTEAFLSTESQRDLGKIGVLALAAAPNSDAAVVMHAATAYVTPPKRSYDGSTAEPELRLDRVALGDQLFVARLAQFLRALCAKIPGSSDAAQVQPVVEAAVWTLFEDAPPAGAELAVVVARGAVRVTVRPRRFLGVALEEVALEVPLG